jgi:glycosyltransferase involved in cell wall biosynthesis
MKIAIAAEHANSSQLTGVEHYTRELILAMARIGTDHEFLLYLRTPPRAWCSNLPRNFTVKHLPSRFAWTQIRLSLAMIADRPDALLIPSFAMPLIHPRNSVVTIHDLAWLLFPDTETPEQRRSLAFTHWFARLFARRLIAVSHATRADLIEKYSVPERRVDVVHHGFSNVHRGFSNTDQPAAPSSENRIAQPYVVCLGTLQPRKNIARLIDAFLLMKQKTGLPHTLVIAGRKGWMCEEVVDKAETAEGVTYLGYVDDRFALLRDADLLVQPSLYEGFGLSVLDAFAQNVPVACSAISSLPEIAGNAAEFFDPYDIESIADAMARVLTGRGHAERLRRRGKQRLNQFTWEACARNTLAVLERQPNSARVIDHAPAPEAVFTSTPYSD